MTLYPKRSSAIWLLLGCAIFVALGLVMGSSGEPMGFLAAAFFGLGIPVAAIQLMPGSAFLHIDKDGITFSSLFKKSFVPWTDIDEFFVVTQKYEGVRTREIVGFNYAPDYDRARTARTVAKMIGKSEGALPDTYGKTAEELARLLNAGLQEAMHRATTPPISGVI